MSRYLRDDDISRLVAAGIYYVDGRSEVGPANEIRPGYARNIVQLRADDEASAIEGVRDALGVTAATCSEWHVREVDDDGLIRQPPGVTDRAANQSG